MLRTMDIPFYVHTLDPVLVRIWGPLAIRWYGLAYVAGFICAYVALHRDITQGRLRLSADDLQTLLYYVIIGVMLGGRLGYLLFYQFSAWRADPVLLFRVWEGGMASHGGMLGLMAAVGLFTRSRQASFLHVTDALATAAPIGIFFGRIANFINGELWGRITRVPWAVIFPQEVGLQPDQPGFGAEVQRLYAAGLLSPRHPSQLYAAVLEGVLLWGVLVWLRRTRWARVDGRSGAAFLLCYALGRSVGELFREPDRLYFGWLTQGQLLSALLALPAGWVLWLTRNAGAAGRTR